MRRMVLPLFIVGVLLLIGIAAGWAYIRHDIDQRSIAMAERYAEMDEEERFLDAMERSSRLAESMGDERSAQLYEELRREQEARLIRDGKPVPTISSQPPTPPPPPPPAQTAGGDLDLVLLGGALALILLLTLGGLVGAGVYFYRQDTAGQTRSS